jgi:uncharacterized SAM-binding protein YcdF (DUF218 family)
MNRERGRRRTWLLALVLAGGLLVVLGARAGRFLVVDAPQPSDVIVVLAGEAYHRPQRALQLLTQGFGQRVVLDVPSTTKIYEFTQIQLAENYVHDLPQAAAITICPIQGLSTRDEAKELKKCLPRGDEPRVLIVTSDFHTRRALSVFRRELPGHSYAVAASRDEQQFGLQWWAHRQWAKTFIDEWLRLIWWEGVDKWR